MSEAGKDRIGDYELLKMIGDGAQGKVFRARCVSDSAEHVSNGQIVALKLLPAGGQGEQSDERFRSKAETLLAIVHPNIVRYLDAFVWHPGEWDEARCLIIELLEGETLEDRLKHARGGLLWPDVKSIFEQCLEGLIYARQQGIIHRDIKPSNIFLCDDGAVKCFDFDIARREGDEQSTAGWKGTFDYMAPDFVTEADFRGDEISDIFSLGMCLCEALTGKLPFPRLGDGAHIGYMARWKGESRPPRPDLRSGVYRVLAHSKSFAAKCLAVDRGNRYHAFADMLADMKRVHYRTITHKGHDVYELRSMLGRGGFGEVFAGIRRSDNKAIAIKHLFSERQSGRFVKEAKILQDYKHPHIVEYMDFMSVAGAGRENQYFLILELLERMPEWNLRTRIKKEGRLDLTEAVRMFIHYLDALSFLHENENPIVHRDIKPTNLYAPAGEPHGAKIFDLGVARDVSGTATSGGVPGTLDYMAPEFAQAGCDRGSPQSDIYALGLCMYEAIVGQPAFPRLPHDINAAWLEFQKRSEKARVSFDHSCFHVFPMLRRILARALEMDPARRYARAADMATELRKLVESLKGQPEPETEVSGDASTLATIAVNPDGFAEADIKEQLAKAGRSEKERKRDPGSVHEGATVATRAADADMEDLARTMQVKRKIRIAIAVVATVVVLGGVGAFLALRPGGQPPSSVTPAATGQQASPSAAAAPVKFSHSPFPRGLPGEEQMRVLSRELRELNSAKKKHADNPELRKAISEIEEYARALPAKAKASFDAVMERRNATEAKRRLDEWLAIASYKDIMGLSDREFASRTSAMREALSALEFDRKIESLMARLPETIRNDPAIIVKADAVAKDCAALEGAGWTGLDGAEKKRRMREVSRVCETLRDRADAFFKDVAGKAAAKIARGGNGNPEATDLAALPRMAPALLALGKDEYNAALKSIAAAREAGLASIRDTLLAAAEAAADTEALGAVIGKTGDWKESNPGPSPEMVSEVDSAIKERYIVLARTPASRSKKAYEALDIEEGDRYLDELKDMAASTPPAYGGNEVSRALEMLAEIRADAQKKTEEQEQTEAAKPEPSKPTKTADTPPAAKTEPQTKPPSAAAQKSVPGILDISVSPRAAKIFVDGKEVRAGATTVMSGLSHEVRVEHMGYQSYEQYYRVNSGETKVVDVLLLPEEKKRGGLFGF